jgi:cytochrome c oxidase assembly protein subunit 15
MYLQSVDSNRCRRYSLLVVCCTFLLVVAGGLVTSNDAAQSVPDWPLSWGRLIPPLEANIRYEFAHRLLALVVTLLTAGLALKLRTRLAWTALATVLAQAALGGVVVKYLSPGVATIAHASLAQLFFGLTVAIYCRAGNPASSRPFQAGLAPLAAAVALFAQTILGAAVRHNLSPATPHIVGAVIATALVMWAGLGTLMTHLDDAALRRPAMLLLSLTFSQVFLGIAAYMSRIATADAPQPMPLMIGFTVAHVAVGSLALGAAIALLLAEPDPSLVSTQRMAAA